MFIVVVETEMPILNTPRQTTLKLDTIFNSEQQDDYSQQYIINPQYDVDNRKTIDCYYEFL